MPVVLPPKVARLDIHTRPAHQQVFGFSGVIFALGNGRQLSPGGCCALTNEGANTLISQPMMTVSAISPSIRRMATTLVLSQPTLDVLGRLFLFLFLGCDPQHNPRAGGPTFANHWPHSQILCLAYFVCSTVAAQNIRGATKWGLSQNGTASNRDNLSESSPILASGILDRLNRTDWLEQRPTTPTDRAAPSLPSDRACRTPQ